MKRKAFIVGLFICVSILGGKYFSLVNQETAHVEAAGTSAITGWMWMDNIGWISLSSTNDHDPLTAGVQPSSVPYGVEQNDTTFVWDGYAWSDNAGWVKFSGGNVVGTDCPVGTATAGDCGSKMSGVSNDKLVGFAKFLSIQPGWDEWISLSSTNDHNLSDPVANAPVLAVSIYGSTLDSNSNDITGYAWHSDGGWVQVSAHLGGAGASNLVLKPTLPSDPALTAGTILAAPDTITGVANGNIKLFWTRKSASPAYTSCSVFVSSGTSTWTAQTINPASVLNTGTGLPIISGNGVNSDTFTFTLAPGIQEYWFSCTDGTTTEVSNHAKVNGAAACNVNTFQWVGGPSYCPAGTPNAGTPEISWTSTGTADCTAAWKTGNATVGSQVVTGGQGSTYTMSCTAVTPPTGTCTPAQPLTLNYLSASDPACTPIVVGPPPEICGNNIDDNNDGNVDEVPCINKKKKYIEN